MSTLRRFTADDLFAVNNMYVLAACAVVISLTPCRNLDPLTENYNISFYLSYLARWPDYFLVAESPSVMGKAEGRNKEWHGHVTAVTVAPEYRRLGLAKQLMHVLEDVSEKIYNGYFVDLFVRISNAVAINMYERMGYTVYRRVLGYYSGDVDEDAFDMRKALKRDLKKESIIPLKHPVRPEDVVFD